jgi:Family of unknown function (DUF5995)
MTETTIDDIILSLQNIISKCTATNSCLGYFANLYLKVTQSVKDGIASGQFQDGPRMEKLDIVLPAGIWMPIKNGLIINPPHHHGLSLLSRPKNHRYWYCSICF